MEKEYQALYREKQITPQQALDWITDGTTVGIGGMGQTPQTFLGGLHTIAPRLQKPVRIYGGGTLSTTGDFPFLNDPACRDKILLDSPFYMNQERAGDGRVVSIVPVHLHASGHRGSVEEADYFVVACTPMDRHGYLRMPLVLADERALADNAKHIIAEVNPNLPNTNGFNQIHISQLAGWYEVDYAIPTLEDPPLTPVDEEIGRLVATLVNDGDTIQLGIGAVPNAAAKALAGKKDLGVHTEMLCSSVAQLVECGAVTGSKKTLFPRQIVATSVYGNQALYDFVDGNPGFVHLPGYVVNDPSFIAQNDNMVSINTCMQVDLMGQVSSETVGTRQYSGSGGQNDTAEGAIHAKNGRSIIAAHSTKKNGTVSTIVPTLLPGAIVTLSRNNLDYLVTEYGIAKLKGKNARERTAALIAVAHPDFRKELQERAVELGFCYPEDFDKA
jgi:acyl-CoA hydrolase